MKKLFAAVVLVMLMGCAAQMKYNVPQGRNFDQAKVDCGDTGSGGYFLFGPLIILAPVVAVIESIKFAGRHKIQDCLEAKGFKCVENCPH